MIEIWVSTLAFLCFFATYFSVVLYFECKCNLKWNNCFYQRILLAIIFIQGQFYWSLHNEMTFKSFSFKCLSALFEWSWEDMQKCHSNTSAFNWICFRRFSVCLLKSFLMMWKTLSNPENHQSVSNQMSVIQWHYSVLCSNNVIEFSSDGKRLIEFHFNLKCTFS